MAHVVRPVWIALAGTTVPVDIKERCQRSFEHIRRFFLEKTGKTFRVEELGIVHTDLTAEHFQEVRWDYVPLLNDFNRIFRLRGGPTYGPYLPGGDIFCLNLVALIRKAFEADNNQAWIIFVPARAEGKEEAKGTARAFHIGYGGYAIISTNFLSTEFATPDRPSFVYTLDGHTWGSGGRVEGLIAHELCHVFGLYDNLEETGRLMGWRSDQLRDCSITKREKELLLRSPFFTEEEIKG